MTGWGGGEGDGARNRRTGKHIGPVDPVISGAYAVGSRGRGLGILGARLATGCLLGSCAQVRGWQSQLDFTRLVDSGMSPASQLPSRTTSIALLVAVWKFYILV